MDEATAALDKLLQNPYENLETEVKEWLDLTTAEHKSLLAKEIIALANHGGGNILIGFSENSDGTFRPADGRPNDLVAWSQDSIQSIIAKYLDPEIQCKTHHRRNPLTGDLHPIITVPGGHRVPIYAKSGSPDNKTLLVTRTYIRRPGPSSEEPRTSIERDALFERIQQNRLSGEPLGISVPNSRDARLLAMFEDLVSENIRRFLREESFGGPMRLRFIEPIYNLCDWQGARYEFIDEEVQSGFVKVLHAARVFAEYFVNHTFVVDNSDGKLVSARTDLDRRNPRPEFYEIIDHLQKKACTLIEAIDDFERVARRRLPCLEPAIEAKSAKEHHPLEAARKGIAHLVEDASRNELPVHVSWPRFVIRMVPLSFAKDLTLEFPQVSEALARMSPNISRYEPGSDDRQWWAYATTRIQDGRNKETAWLSRIIDPCYLEHSATMGWAEREGEAVLVDGLVFERQVVQALTKMSDTARFLQLGQDALATLTLEGLAGVELTLPRSGKPFKKENIAFPEILVTPDKSEGECLKDTFNRIWRAAGWEAGSPSYQGGIWAGYTNPNRYGEGR
jgi:hypothetical protein